MRGSEGIFQENCGKKEGKREKCEKIEKREKMGRRERVKRKEEEKREKERLGLLHDTANVVGTMPAMSRPLLHKKRPCSNRFGKTQKMRNKNKKNANLSRANTGSSPQTDQNGTSTGPDGHRSKMPHNFITTVQDSAKMQRTAVKTTN